MPRLACVLGDMDLVRPLGLAGVRCAVVAAPNDAIRRSRFVDDVIEWDEESEHPDELVERLVRFGRSQADPPVLFYQHDPDLLLVSGNRDRLEENFRFVIGDGDTVDALVDKVRFEELARRLALPVPFTAILRPAPGSAPPDDLVYPLILKPSTRALASWGRVEPVRKAVPLGSPGELEAMWPRLVEAGAEVLAQEEVPGPEARIESYHAYVDTTGTTVADFTGRKVRTLPLAFGHTTSCVLTEQPDVRDLGREVLRRLELSGVAKVDFKRAADGSLRLLEINPRFNLWHHPGARAGVNIPALVWADLTGAPRPPAHDARPGVRWCSAGDRLAAREANVPFARWLTWAVRCEAKHGIAWDDPGPMVARVLAKMRAGQ